MKTEIPPFDSETKDQLIPNDSFVAIYGPLRVKRNRILSNYATGLNKNID
jgi:hypothetical protein